MDIVTSVLGAPYWLWAHCVATLGQMDFRFDWHDIGVVFAVGILDGLLSVDNALVNASLAAHLPKKQQMRAVIFGLLAGAVLRALALFFVAFLIANPWLRVIGAAYLSWLVFKHFVLETKEEEQASEHARDGELQRRFVQVIFLIGWTDLAFSVDNVVATVAMSTRIFVVMVGVGISILVMMFATTLVVQLIRRYPRLEHTAFVVIGMVAVAMLLEDAHTLFAPFSDFVQVPEIVIPSMVKFSATITLVALTIVWEEGLRHGARREARRLAAVRAIRS